MAVHYCHKAFDGGVEFLKVNSYLFKFLENRLEIFKIFFYKDRYAIHIADPSSI